MSRELEARVGTMGDPSDSPTAGTVPSDSQPSPTPNQVSPLPWTWTPCETEGPSGDDEIVAGAQLVDARGKSVFTEDCGDYRGLSDDAARRIVQSVNQYPALLQQRKELLEALKAIVACFGSSEFRASGCGCAECVAVNGAEAAIAKAEHP